MKSSNRAQSEDLTSLNQVRLFGDKIIQSYEEYYQPPLKPTKF